MASTMPMKLPSMMLSAKQNFVNKQLNILQFQCCQLYFDKISKYNFSFLPIQFPFLLLAALFLLAVSVESISSPKISFIVRNRWRNEVMVSVSTEVSGTVSMEYNLMRITQDILKVITNIHKVYSIINE